MFVFVTPRRWGQRDSWAATKRAENVWKDVRAYDADSLEQWLDETPAVHVRVTHMRGRDPGGAADLLSAWCAWSAFTAPPLPTALMTAARDEQVRAVLAWLRGEPSELFVVSESAEWFCRPARPRLRCRGTIRGRTGEHGCRIGLLEWVGEQEDFVVGAQDGLAGQFQQASIA